MTHYYGGPANHFGGPRWQPLSDGNMELVRRRWHRAFILDHSRYLLARTSPRARPLPSHRPPPSALFRMHATATP